MVTVKKTNKDLFWSSASGTFLWSRSFSADRHSAETLTSQCGLISVNIDNTKNFAFTLPPPQGRAQRPKSRILHGTYYTLWVIIICTRTEQTAASCSDWWGCWGWSRGCAGLSRVEEVEKGLGELKHEAEIKVERQSSEREGAKGEREKQEITASAYLKVKEGYSDESGREMRFGF